MVLLIDHYDSFSFNIYQLIGSLVKDIKVIRSDEMTVKEIKELSPDCVILSPGTGRPKVCMKNCWKYAKVSFLSWAFAWAIKPWAKCSAPLWDMRKKSCMANKA